MLPFDAEALTALYEQYNRSIWPGQVVAILLAAGTLGLTARPSKAVARAIGLVLGAGWAWTGAVFLLQQFAPINFAAPVYGWLFLVQGGLLLWSLTIRGQRVFDLAPGAAGWAALVLAILALVLVPLGEGLVGSGWAAVELPGLAPDATAVFTLAVLAITRGRTPLHLAVLPFLWSVAAGLTAWTLEAPGLSILPAAGIAGSVVIVWKNRRSED
jgi:hypothetical protein